MSSFHEVLKNLEGIIAEYNFAADKWLTTRNQMDEVEKALTQLTQPTLRSVVERDLGIIKKDFEKLTYRLIDTLTKFKIWGIPFDESCLRITRRKENSIEVETVDYLTIEKFPHIRLS